MWHCWLSVSTERTKPLMKNEDGVLAKQLELSSDLSERLVWKCGWSCTSSACLCSRGTADHKGTVSCIFCEMLCFFFPAVWTDWHFCIVISNGGLFIGSISHCCVLFVLAYFYLIICRCRNFYCRGKMMFACEALSTMFSLIVLAFCCLFNFLTVK